MRKLTLLLTLAVIAALTFGATADGYVPKRGKACHKGYVKKHRVVKRHGHKKRVRVCVKKRKAAPGAFPASTRRTLLHARLDPSYTRDPKDPFTVTYQYEGSASAVVTQQGEVTEEPTPSPSGVLALYSDGSLECAINVGGPLDEAECPVTYLALGEHRVTTVYTAGDQSATATEVKTIEPLPTTTALTATFSPAPPHEASTGVYLLGELTAQTSGTLDGGPLPGDVLAHRANDGSWEVSVGGSPYGPLPVALTLHATTHPTPGYTGSEATVEVPFSPTLPGLWSFTSQTVEDDGWALVDSEQYLKQTGAATPLTARLQFVRSGISAGCFTRLEVDGQPEAPDDEGREATGSSREQVRQFAGLAAGSVDVEVYVSAQGGEPCEVVGTLYASE
jgi:hypothetical protein